MRAVKNGQIRVVSGFANKVGAFLGTSGPHDFDEPRNGPKLFVRDFKKRNESYSLGSGSTGNAVLISTEKTNVLVDAGMSAREILRRLAEVGVDCDDLDGVLITHEHSDHAGGLRVLLRSLKCRVYISRITETRSTTRGRAESMG
jgi:glyoxylase-like metal-dependent hydrolase (beta-lactamase superfamily II)